MAKAIKRPARSKLPAPTVAGAKLLNDVRTLIETARERIAQAVNSTLVGLYWHIGKRIREDVLQEKRAEYSKQSVQALSAQLTQEYGRGFSRQNLFHMMSFAEVCPDEQIVSALIRQLPWTHLIYIIPLEEPRAWANRARCRQTLWPWPVCRVSRANLKPGLVRRPD
jgi:hypothetical protein